MPADYPIELMPREQAAALYPAPYSDELLRYATPRGLDPRLMLAIMRQESRFRSDTKSAAAARGLMQFTAPTATQVANELGRDRFSQDDIYHAPTAVLFGSHYMAGLFERFRGKTEAVLASYNAGDDNVQRWLSRARSSQPERYVPELMFAQTKEYVERVMANYRMYQQRQACAKAVCDILLCFFYDLLSAACQPASHRRRL
jgi:soluble lytic murein transglycosylase